MKTLLTWAVGTLAALLTALAMDSFALKNEVTVYRAAFRLPTALVSPVFILNYHSFQEEFYQAYRRKEAKKTGRYFTTPSDVRFEAMDFAAVQGPIWSAFTTVAFWLPFFLLRSWLSRPITKSKGTEID